MDSLYPAPQTPTCRCVQFIQPTNLSQALFHFRPTLYTRGSDSFGQALGEPFFFVFIEGDDTAHEKGPGDGAGLWSGSHADCAVGFALFDEVHELGFEALHYGADGKVHVEGEFNIDKSSKTTGFDVVVEIGHL